MKIKLLINLILLFILIGCGKIGPLDFPKDKLNKGVISYPCDEVCMKKFEDEKLRQQSVILQAN